MSALSDAWQLALGAEQQAVFGYALAGAHLDTGTSSQLARTSQRAHETLRDKAVAAIIAAGGAPNQPPADYPSLYPVRDARSALRLTIRLENDAASAWRYLYAVGAQTTGAPSAVARTVAQAGLTASAVRATQCRVLVNPAAAGVAFPGI